MIIIMVSQELDRALWNGGIGTETLKQTTTITKKQKKTGHFLIPQLAVTVVQNH